jgi:hypothetical protein
VTRRGTRALDALRGAARLAVHATVGVADVVEAMQLEIGGGPRVLGRPFLAPTRLFSAPVYASVRAAARAIGAGLDRALAGVAPALGAASVEHDSALAVLNGVVGDFLAETGNPLAIRMALRHGGEPLLLERRALRAAFPGARPKLLVLAHGACRHDRQWSRRGAGGVGDLAEELGYTRIDLHYNTGLHVAANGRAFAALLERLVASWPRRVEEVAIVGHSMGGLVARSACHAAEQEGHAWRRRLRTLVCVASPHHGAPLERGGHVLETLLELSRYSAPLARVGRLRSAGVTDLRFGDVLDEHRDGRGRLARGRHGRRTPRLPAGVRCCAIAATRTRDPGARKRSGDGLVTVDSALGRHRDPELTLAFDETWIGYGMGHIELLHRPEVHAVVRAWLAARGPDQRGSRPKPRTQPGP